MALARLPVWFSSKNTTGLPRRNRNPGTTGGCKSRPQSCKPPVLLPPVRSQRAKSPGPGPDQSAKAEIWACFCLFFRLKALSECPIHQITYEVGRGTGIYLSQGSAFGEETAVGKLHAVSYSIIYHFTVAPDQDKNACAGPPFGVLVSYGAWPACLNQSVSAHERANLPSDSAI